ncbi:Protein CBG22853 [Caenorhabditis briggsae]|uniref:Protein CBG22853 n=1 Tax=Caenorhabditis briggsae TaxID=6238 RepID=A8Y377_CAEBR|nr:Protein CBG22853 [Caenorhabditis briggsae]CAP39346.1 Protein CBG22853 [Caenorhabditis briggsae]
MVTKDPRKQYRRATFQKRLMDVVTRTRDLVTKLMPSAIPSTTQPTSSQKSNLIAKLYHSVSDQANSTSTSSEISRYLSEYYDPSTNESVEEYWKRKRFEYPGLYSAALFVFSIVPCEAMCETTFSTASFLLDKTRTRLLYKRVEMVVLGSQIATKFPHWLD